MAHQPLVGEARRALLVSRNGCNAAGAAATGSPAASDLPPRTIRFYIARGLLNGPAKGDRVPEYTAEHVLRLERIKRLQADGHTLLEVGRIVIGPFREVRNGTADGVVATWDRRRRHRVGARWHWPVANDTTARGEWKNSPAA
jgi:DNA-binding transcriptional MerR regulator